MKVYRLQTMDNKGPYNALKWHNPFADCPALEKHAYPKYRSNNRNKYMPRAKFKVTRQYIFGFVNLEQMRNWFSKRQIKAFEKYGYVLAVYIVNKNKIKQDDAQVAFIPKSNPTFYPLSSVWEA